MIDMTMKSLRWIIQRWRQWLPFVPLGALFWAGYVGCGIWDYINITAVFVAAVLICDPFGLASMLFAPGSRICVILFIVLVLISVELPSMGMYFRIWMQMVAIAALAVVFLKNSDWLMDWKIKQSPQADDAISDFVHGGKSDAVDAWERYGCREARAVIHQACNIQCTESLMSGVVKAVYLLAFLHGKAFASKKIRSLEAKIERQKEDAEINLSIFGELHEKNNQIAELEEQLQDARAANEALRFQIKMRNEPPEEPENRDDAIRAYIKGGHSYRQAAERFGLSKTRISEIVKQGA